MSDELKFLDEAGVVLLTEDIKTFANATYEPKKLIFNNVVVPTSAFDQNLDNYTITITLNTEVSPTQYLTFDRNVFDQKILSLNLADGSYGFYMNGSGFTI